MPATLAQLAERARAAAPPVLVPGDFWARLGALDDPFGSSLAWLGLECRLAGPGPVDAAVCVGRRGLDALREAPLPWPRAAAFVQEWAESLRPVVHFAWFEFDGGSGEPFVFAALSGRPDEPVPTGDLALAAMDVVLPLLRGRPLAAGVREGLERCVSALPRGAFVLHFAPLITRGSDAVRLVVTLPWASLDDWLAEAGWAGEDVTNRAARLGMFASHLNLQCDVGTRLGERIGVEYFYPAPGGDRRWEVLFEGLLAEGLCPGERARAARGWPGEGRRQLQVKVAWTPRGPAEAKAYLAQR